jgi:uncharacterized protein YjbI with pentapeptide repeats
MSKRFENEDLSGATFDFVNLAGVRMRDVNLAGAKLHASWHNVTITGGPIDGMTVNGIEIAPLIAAEVDRRYPERAKMSPADPAGFAEALAIVESQWQETLARGRKLGDDAAQERVDDEWSFVETVRHMLFVIDTWVSRVVLGADDYHRLALPPTFIRGDLSPLGIEAGATPTLEEVMAAFEARLDTLRGVVERLTPEELTRDCSPKGPGFPPEGMPATVIGALHTVFNEAWWHNRFANRDFDTIEKRSA